MRKEGAAMGEKDWLEIWSGQNQLQKVIEMNEKTQRFGLVLSEAETKMLVESRNENYYDTVTKAIPGFFGYYDARFAPQETIITMDYPTICPITDYSGIDAIEKYIWYIFYEQQFMGAIPQEYVQGVLFRYQADYRKQFYNICSIILRHILGNMLIGKRLGQRPTEADYEMLRAIILQHDKKWLEEAFSNLLERMILERFDKDKELERYLQGDIPAFVTELSEAVTNNHLKRRVVL